tara:strand:- start:645 stop:1157 length:513 start_codon:yes stop_codon:yes gene_type:complete
MKITKQRLQQIIKEELQNFFAEQEDLGMNPEMKSGGQLVRKLLEVREHFVRDQLGTKYEEKDVVDNPQQAYRDMMFTVKNYWTRNKNILSQYSKNERWEEALTELGKLYNKYAKSRDLSEQLVAIEKLVPEDRQPSSLAETGLAKAMQLRQIDPVNPGGLPDDYGEPDDL